jgi:hypothetical protein
VLGHGGRSPGSLLTVTNLSIAVNRTSAERAVDGILRPPTARAMSCLKW